MSQEFFIQNQKTGLTENVTREQYEDFHNKNYANAQGAEEQQQAITDYLTGMRSKSGAKLPGQLEMANVAGNKYKNRLNDEQRIYQLNSPITELGKKKANAEKILIARNTQKENEEKYSDNLLKKGNYNKIVVKGVSAFFTGDKKADKEILRSWLTRSEDPGAMLTCCINEFLKLPLDDLDLSTDKDMANNAPLLEKICAQHEAIIRIVSENGSAYKKIPEELRDSFEKKISQVNGLVNYYRLMSEVMTNAYYITHENNELSRKKSDKDTDEQKQLFKLIEQSQAGLMALKNLGARELDRKLGNMTGELSRTVVASDKIKLQRELAEREKLVEKLGFAEYLNYLERKGTVDGMRKNPQKGIFDRAKDSIVELELPERVENGCASIIGILDQLEFVKRLTKEKKDFQNCYYLEHNYREIAKMDEVEKISGPLKIMKNAILRVSNISDKGVLETIDVTMDERRACQEMYTIALKQYKDIMNRVVSIRNNDYVELPADSDMLDRMRYHSALKLMAKKDRKSLPKKTEGEIKQLREQLKDLYLTLEENEYSDISIYRNASEIMRLKGECMTFLSTDEYNRINAIAEIAFDLVLNKRKNAIGKALQQDNVPEGAKQKLQSELKALGDLTPEKEEENRKKALERYRTDQLQLRLDAQKMKFDTADLKATAVHYLSQEEWVKNSTKPAKRGNIFMRFLRSAASGITRFMSWTFSKTRSSNHGAQLYDKSKENLKQLPKDLENFGEEGATQSITHGDGVYAPKIELNKYFKDPMKMKLAGDCKDIKKLMKEGENYPPCITDAVEALSCYACVRGVVNSETFEMEQAFLDKLKNSVETLLKDLEISSKYVELTKKIYDTYAYIERNCYGRLNEYMTDEELEAVKETKAIYTTKTYFGDNEESNVRDLPLFPHSPQLNDIKQGALGNCYMLAAVQALIVHDPEAIQKMFYDMGDGNVIVRFYAAYGENKDGVYTRIDDIGAYPNATMRPVYVKVRKHYTTGEEGSSFCLWMQLLEKAYAAAGFNEGAPDIDENGELHNLNDELTAGTHAHVLMHMTGQRYLSVDVDDVPGIKVKNQSEIEKDAKATNLQRRMLFRSIPAYLHEPLYKELMSQGMDMSGYATDQQWEEQKIRGAIDKVIADNKKVVDSIKDILDKHVKDKKMNEEDRDSLLSILYRNYVGDEVTKSDYCKYIMRNLSASDYENLDALDDLDDVNTMKQKLVNALDGGKMDLDTLGTLLFSEQKNYYPAIPADDVTKKEKEEIQFSVDNLMVPNPEGRYSQKELAYLRYIRHMLGKGQPMAMGTNSGHVMTALDIKLHQGKWFVLIRDPFNSYRYEYTQKQDNKADKDTYGFFTAVWKHKDVRRLSPNMKDGFMGISWWELKDVAKQFGDIAFLKSNQ